MSCLMDSNSGHFWCVDSVWCRHLLIMVVAVSFCILDVAASRIDRPQLRELGMWPSATMARGLMSTQTDTEALLQFKSQMESDPLRKLEGWNGGGDVCTWFGVSCASERVVKVELGEAGLVGTALMVSSLITSLDKLRYLDLSGNKFNGNLSSLNSAKGSCGSLETVILGSNSLDGGIPSDLLSCGTIQHLDLSDNLLSGNVPEDLFSQCGSLQVLDLSNNRLAASLPPAISMCSSLRLLNLSSNRLVGVLPLDLLSPNCSSCASTEAVYTLETLDLSFNNLSGTISDIIFTRCGGLIFIDLSANAFSGEIPGSIDNCNSLQELNFSLNKLESRLPVSLGSLTSLKRLDVSNNHIGGPIPFELGQLCSTLLHLDLSMNNISGTIPTSFASCYSLQTLNLTHNNLSGSFPADVVSQLRNVENLLFAFNKFSGPMPISVTNCSNLRVLDLSSNKINGRMPAEMCPLSFSLEKLLAPNNEIWGEVPAGLANCSQLKMLDLSFNNLYGALPQELGSMSNLESLMLWFNGLTGEIPTGLGNLANLKILTLNNNALSGHIPLQLSNNTSLEWLCLSNNKLTGRIPPFIGRMPRLTIVELGNNSLYGSIPNEFANGSKFLWLDLNSNYLSGSIPPGLGRHARGPLTELSGVLFAFVRNQASGCRGLGSLLEIAGITQDALDRTPLMTSCNSTRLYPSFVDYPDFSTIQFLDLSYNRLEGAIPDEMGYLTALQMLSLGHNQLVGTIPATFSNLNRIGVLDLSYNKLEGGISPLALWSFLVQVDVSNNNLSGEIPSTGQLSTAPAAGFVNNPGLCGEPLPPCGSIRSDGDTSNNCTACINNNRLSVFPWANSIVLAILISVALVCMIVVWVFMMRSKGKHKDTDLLGTLQASCHGNSSWNLGTDREPLSINVATFERPLRKLTFAQLVEATNGFSEESLVGIGGFGEVYKAELKDGSVVAIKKLLQFSFQGDREFTAEMETLGKIKHRHLVPLLGYCKVGEERLLVYEYMHGGSLDEMLHGEGGKEKLTWDMRKQIAKGAARGLAFLHHNCIPHIIHRDMKSSNVLLDINLEARVSDFGMARLISALDTHLSVSTLAGTPGYVPPEYYQSFRCTTKGDVYSFGVILLELLTGKRPTDKEEFEDSNLVGWVRQHLDQKKCMEVLDPLLKGVGAEHEMMYYLKIASDCLDDHPSRRPSMQQVVTMFKELQAQETKN